MHDHDSDDDTIIVGAGIDFTDPNSPLAPFYFRASHIALAIFLAVLFALMTHLPLWHTDVWAHVRFGQEIVRHGLPEHEPFPESYAEKEPQYIHYQWLTQVGYYLLYEAGAKLSPPDADHRLGGGALFLVAAHALFVVLRLLLLFKAFTRLTDSPPVALLGVLLVFAMSALYNLGVQRPQVLGELAFAAVLLALSWPVLSRRALVVVPLVFLVWANCHGSFAMGFALLGAVLVGRAVEVVWGEDQSLAGLGTSLRAPGAALRALRADTQFRRLAAVVALSVLATMVNPHGPYLLVRSYLLSQNANIPTMEEWKSLPYHGYVMVAFLGSVLLLAVVLRLSPRRVTPAQVILLLGFGLQTVAHSRMMVWWIMVVAWVVVPHLHAALSRRKIAWLNDPSVPSFMKTVLAALIVAMLLMWSRPAFWLLYHEAPESAGRVKDVTPVRVLDCVRDADPTRLLGGALAAGTPPEAAAVAGAAETLRGPEWQERPRVVFSSETEGDYLLWALGQGWQGPPVRLVCYTHVHLFSAEHWRKCMAAKLAAPNWQEVLDEMGADFIVLEDNLYEQSRHRAEGKPGGFSNLIDRVRAAGDRWQVISEPDAPVFIAQRVR